MVISCFSDGAPAGRPYPRMHQMGSALHVSDAEQLSHFSSFALSGDTGVIRWHHLPGDFKEDSTPVKIHVLYFIENFTLVK